MTSKNSFFKLFVRNLSGRLWTLALSLILFFLCFPVATAMLVSTELHVSSYEEDYAGALVRAKANLFRAFQALAGPENFFFDFLVITLAVLLAISAFSYLHQARKTDFYHSLPISRNRLYLLANAGSVFIFAVPYLLFSLTAAGIASAYSGYSGCFPAALRGFGIRLCWFLLAYSTSVIAVMLTGHPAVALLGILVFFCWGPAVSALGFGLPEMYWRTFYQDTPAIMSFVEKTSPVSWIISENGNTVFRALIALPVSFVFFLLGAWLYRMRRSEAAGKAMAFKPTEVPIKALLVIPITICGASVMQSARSSEAWGIFGGLFSLIVSSCVIEIIYRFDFKKLFDRKWLTVLCGLVSVAVLAGVRLGAPLYDRYIPSDDRIASAGIHLYDLENPYDYTTELVWENGSLNYSRGSEMDILRAMKITDKSLIRELAENGTSFTARADRDLPYTDQTTAIVVYHLTSGRDMVRRYRIELNDAGKAAEQRLYDSPEYKEAFYPVLRRAASDYVAANYMDLSGYHHIDFPDESTKEALVNAYRKDLLSLTDSVRKSNAPIGGIQFQTKAFREAADYSREHGNTYLGMLNSWQYYPIYPSFAETLSVLESCGVTLNSFFKPENIAQATVEYYGDITGEKEIFTTDPEEIREILNSASVCIERLSYTSRLEAETDYTVYLRVRSETVIPAESEDLREDYAEGEGRTVRMVFRKGQVPDFVKEKVNPAEPVWHAGPVTK